MPTKDTVLSLDLEPGDCWYRILREEPPLKRVVYVHLKNIDMIPKWSQSYGPGVIKELSKLKSWSDPWETLVISRNESHVLMEQNVFKAHSLPPEQILGVYPQVNLLDLTIAYSVKTRVHCVKLNGTECFMKIARFSHEITYLAREVKAYHALACHDSLLAPKFLGYVFEGSQERIVGFVFEKISGRRPGIADLEACGNALRELHRLEIIHKDLNRDNIFITNEGVRFVDFEDSCVGQADLEDLWESLKLDEEQNLPKNLLDESGKGRPLMLSDAESHIAGV